MYPLTQPFRSAGFRSQRGEVTSTPGPVSQSRGISPVPHLQLFNNFSFYCSYYSFYIKNIKLHVCLSSNSIPRIHWSLFWWQHIDFYKEGEYETLQ